MYSFTVQSPSPPIMVRIVETNEIHGLGDVLVQAVGISGAMAIGALVFGVLLAAIIIICRNIRARLEGDGEIPQTQPLGLTPAASVKLESET
jgi:hypothetical protein